MNKYITKYNVYYSYLCTRKIGYLEFLRLSLGVSILPAVFPRYRRIPFRVNSITHNCTLGYKNKNKPTLSNQFELTVTPDLIAKAALELAPETLEKEITTINAELRTLTSVMNTTGYEASSISTSLNEIH